MSYFYNPLPQFENANGVPFAGGLMYFGEPNVDPKDNPKTIWLNADLTAPASNPQPLNSAGIAQQGTLYLNDGEEYSFLLEDADGNQISNLPSIVGVNLPSNLDEVPAVIVEDSVTIRGLTDAELVIDSGVSPGAEGIIDFQESTTSQWRWIREAIVDGGALILVNVTQALARVMEVLPDGVLFLRYLGNDRITLDALGMKFTGFIGGNKQVLAAGGTFLNDGTPVGETLGITSITNTGTGEYTVTLDFFPLAEVDLLVNTSAELAGEAQITRGVGGSNGSGEVLVFTYNGNNVAPTDATSFTVSVFDLGRG